MLLRNLFVVVLVALGTGCEHNPVSTDGPVYTIRFSLSNQLLAPVTLTVDGEPHVSLLGGGSANVAVPSTARWLSWTSAKPAGADGGPIPDDIGEGKIAVAGLSPALEISNVIGNQGDITASVLHSTAR